MPILIVSTKQRGQKHGNLNLGNVHSGRLGDFPRTGGNMIQQLYKDSLQLTNIAQALVKYARTDESGRILQAMGLICGVVKDLMDKADTNKP